MAGTSYITISITAIVVAIAVLTGFYGCKPHSNSPEISGISLTQSHMNFGACYSFYLREEDGKIVFDAQVRFEEEPYCIILESCETHKTSLENLRKIAAEYKIADYVRTYKKPPSIFNVSDETVNKTTVYFADGTEKSASTSEKYKEALYNFFLSLAKENMDKSVYIPNE